MIADQMDGIEGQSLQVGKIGEQRDRLSSRKAANAPALPATSAIAANSSSRGLAEKSRNVSLR